jgi:hypothetical protein
MPRNHVLRFIQHIVCLSLEGVVSMLLQVLSAHMCKGGWGRGIVYAHLGCTHALIFCLALLQLSQQAAPKAVDDALREAEALLRSIKSEGGNPSMPASDLGTTDFSYACDENGCVLVVQQESRETAGGAATCDVQSSFSCLPKVPCARCSLQCCLACLCVCLTLVLLMTDTASAYDSHVSGLRSVHKPR